MVATQLHTRRLEMEVALDELTDGLKAKDAAKISVGLQEATVLLQSRQDELLWDTLLSASLTLKLAKDAHSKIDEIQRTFVEGLSSADCPKLAEALQLAVDIGYHGDDVSTVERWLLDASYVATRWLLDGY